MSRIGLKVIEVPEKVTVAKNGDDITVKGPKGELTRYFDPRITFEQKMEKFILVVQVKLTKLFTVLKEQTLLP